VRHQHARRSVLVAAGRTAALISTWCVPRRGGAWQQEPICTDWLRESVGYDRSVYPMFLR
jgi:hypothetical protein